jgi:site-specific recombinase
MSLFNRRNKILTTNNAPDVPVIKIDSIYRGLDYLVEFVKQIRPTHYKDFAGAELRFKAMFYQLQHDKVLLFSLRKALLTQFSNSTVVPALTDSGMVKSRGFLQELVTKIKHKLLPPLQQPSDFLFVINHVFYHPKDHIWVDGIDRQLWVNFFKVIGFQVSVSEPAIIKELNKALFILSQRVVTLGLEHEIIGNKVLANIRNYPFVKLDVAIHTYLRLFEIEAGPFQLDQHLQNINDALHECRSLINEISEVRKQHGTSLSQTYILFRIEQHIERLLLITDALDHDIDFNADRFLSYFIQIIYFEKRKNSLREFMSANFSFLAYKITEHGGKRGENYMTTTRGEYWAMIRSAMGGGFIISFIAVIKTLLHKVPLPPFWQGFAYSVNYAFGFQLLHETHTTLATKQPAYTASAIAGSLDMEKSKSHPDMHAIAITIARTVRSQIASFAGNLLLVFPVSYLLAVVYHFLTGDFLVDSNEAHKLLVDQHPLKSFSILYACFTGFFLFLSGLIAGYVENGINYGKVGERLGNHPLFKNVLPAKKLSKITHYVENHFGALMGNISLGFFLGMAGFFGNIFGVPFDIRHITIAAGNSSIAFYTNGHNESALFLWTVFAGVLLIGLFNFLVSFACAFFVALKSREVRLREFPELFVVLARFFFHYPRDFFFPPKHPRSISDVKHRLYKRA